MLTNALWALWWLMIGGYIGFEVTICAVERRDRRMARLVLLAPATRAFVYGRFHSAGWVEDVTGREVQPLEAVTAGQEALREALRILPGAGPWEPRGL